MGEEPTNSELARQLRDIREDIRSMIATLIGRAEYASDQRGLLYRLEELSRDLSEERRERAEDIKALHDRISDQAKAGVEHRQHWRSLLWMGVLPALATLIVGLLAFWAAHSGGH